MTALEFFQLLEDIVSKIMGVESIKRVGKKNGTEAQRIGRILFVNALNEHFHNYFESIAVGCYLGMGRGAIYSKRHYFKDFLEFNPEYKFHYNKIISRMKSITAQYFESQLNQKHSNPPTGSFLLRNITTQKLEIKSISDLCAGYQPVLYFEG